MKNLNFFVFVFCALICTSAIAQTLPAYLPVNGLVAWYPFNGNANDESGNGNNGTVNGAQLSEDRNFVASSSFVFVNGTHISVPMNAQLFQLPVKTFSCWFKSIGNQNGGRIYENTFMNGGIAFHYNGGNLFDVFYAYELYCTGMSNLDAGEINQWHHLVSITDESLAKATVYLDGSIIGQTDATPAGVNGCFVNANWPWQNQFMRFGIGASNEAFNGLIDDIAIYNRALTQEEITALYTGTPVNNNGGNTTANAVPPGIPYQAVVRNANGQVAAITAATTKFTLHQNTTDGAVEYQETHALTTNAQGLVSAVIGQGTAVQGTFAGINWSNTTKFLQVEVDLGNGYVDLGTQQLMSVPFALYAANGPQGAQGPAGPQGPAGADGADGSQGPAGSDGNSISSVVIQNNHLMVTLSNGTIMDAGAVLTEGCTNSAACNYSSSAMYDNGSCLIEGQTCDDGIFLTIGDFTDESCQCVGTYLTGSEITLGDSLFGGKIAYLFQPTDIGYVEGEIHGIIAANNDLPDLYHWGCVGGDINGAEGVGVGDGAQNTADMVSNNCGTAAITVWNLVENGYTDWILPSIGELNILYNNRLSIGGFSDLQYWSSSEYDPLGAWILNFQSGTQSNNYKHFYFYNVRPIRYF